MKNKELIRGIIVLLLLVGGLIMANFKPMTQNYDSLLIIRENIFNIIILLLVLIFDRILEALMKIN